jgi:hypothetical protein
MKIGVFAKTFSRPTIEELFQAIADYRINSVQFNLPCVGRNTKTLAYNSAEPMPNT